jgi:hypothetical protein
MCTSSHSVLYQDEMMATICRRLQSKTLLELFRRSQKKRSQFSEIKYIKRKIRIKLCFSILSDLHIRGVNFLSQLLWRRRYPELIHPSLMQMKIQVFSYVTLWLFVSRSLPSAPSRSFETTRISHKTSERHTPDSSPVSDWESQCIDVVSSERTFQCLQEQRLHITYDDPLNGNVPFTEKGIVSL